jgi:hypothetical protein
MPNEQSQTTACPLCQGMGEVHREDIANNHRLSAWPCAYDCPPGGNPFVRTTVTPDRAKKMTALMWKKLAKMETASGN